MRYKALIVVMSIAFVLLSGLMVSATPPEDLVSEAVLLMDADTGQILYEHNMNKRMYPASTTKIMTAVLVLENVSADETTTVSASAIDIREQGSSNIALQEGERLPVRDALYALMLPSANDAANVLAEYVGGSQEAFARMMTGKAKEIGAVNTNFTNAHGLHEPDHYSTAYDIALITRYAVQNEQFNTYFGAATYVMPPTNLQPLSRSFTNHQYMLNHTTGFYNADVLGGKVGYTTEARHTMSTVATKDGRTLICTVLYSPYRNDKFYDTEKLLDYGFEAFTPYTVPADTLEQFTVPIGSQGNIVGYAAMSMPKDVTLLLPEEADPQNLQISYEYSAFFASEEAVAGKIVFSLADTEKQSAKVLLELPMETAVEMASVPVVLTMPSQGAAFSLTAWLEGALNHSLAFLLVALAGVLLVLVAMVAVRQYRLHRNRKKRMDRMARRNRESASILERDSRALIRGRPVASGRTQGEAKASKSSAGRTTSSSRRPSQSGMYQPRR